MAGAMQRSLCCFAVLAAVTFFRVQCANTPKNPNVLNPATSATAKPASNPQIGVKSFLAGEGMPVWLASWDNTKKEVTYKRFEEGIVKDAIRNAYLNAPPSRTPPSTEIPKWTNEKLKETAKKIENEAANLSSKIFHPSILAVMEYKTKWPKGDEVKTKEMIMRRIVYALSFFHGVDIHLRVLQHPEVRLRVAGIVICQDKRAVPYVNRNMVGEKGLLAVTETLHPMSDHWRRTFDNNADFSSKAFDIVVTMTGAKPTTDSTNAIAVSSPEPYCGKTKEPAVVLVVDHFDFSGVQAAVYEISRVLGADNRKGHPKYGSKECPTVPLHTEPGMKRTWFECSLDSVSKTLNTIGFCFEHAKEYYPPGKPIDPILPGKLKRASRQCKERGWEDGNVCWHLMTCDQLYCQNDSVFSFCKDSGPALDGTTCGKSRMCILGNCVSNTTLI